MNSKHTNPNVWALTLSLCLGSIFTHATGYAADPPKAGEMRKATSKEATEEKVGIVGASQANPCQPLVDEALRQAQTGIKVSKVSTDKLRKDLEECGKKNKMPVVGVEIGKKTGLEDRAGFVTVMSNTGGSILCVKIPQYFIFYLWGTFPSGGPKFHAASVQYETTLYSSLVSFGPGLGSSVGTGLVRNIPNMSVDPNINPLLFVVFTAGFTPMQVNTGFGTGGNVFGIFSTCVSIDRSP